MGAPHAVQIGDLLDDVIGLSDALAEERKEKQNAHQGDDAAKEKVAAVADDLTIKWEKPNAPSI